MNKLHKQIAINQERYVKKLAKQVPAYNEDTSLLFREFYEQIYHFSSAAAAHTLINMKRSKVQRLARYFRRSSLRQSEHGTYFSTKFAIWIYVAHTGPERFTKDSFYDIYERYDKFVSRSKRNVCFV